MSNHYNYIPYEFDYSDMPDVSTSDPQLLQLAMGIIAQYQQNQSRFQQQALYEQLLSLGVSPETAAAFHVGPPGTQPPLPTMYGSLPDLRSSHLHMSRHDPRDQAFSPPDSFLTWFESNQQALGFGAPHPTTASVPHLPIPPASSADEVEAKQPEAQASRPTRPQRRASTTSSPLEAGSSRTKSTSLSNWLPEELAGRKPASPPATTAEEKRQRNTEASTRFRMKKKIKTLNIQRLVADLTGRAEELEKEAEELRKENGWLKEIVALKGHSIVPQETPQSSTSRKDSPEK